MGKTWEKLRSLLRPALKAAFFQPPSGRMPRLPRLPHVAWAAHRRDRGLSGAEDGQRLAGSGRSAAEAGNRAGMRQVFTYPIFRRHITPGKLT